jgi:hypothetical protein
VRSSASGVDLLVQECMCVVILCEWEGAHLMLILWCKSGEECMCLFSAGTKVGKSACSYDPLVQ